MLRQSNDAYEISPIQAGMLLHATMQAGHGIDIQQIVSLLKKTIDVDRLVEAWHDIMRRHPVLRTSFRWLDCPQPLQEVQPEVALRVARFDWSDLDPGEQDKRLDAFLAADRLQEFDLRQAPLSRLTFIRTAAHVVMVWTFHHILLDGRAFAPLLQEVFEFVESPCGTQKPESSIGPEFRQHVEWLNARDTAASRAYWTERLAGFRVPLRLWVERPKSSQSSRDATAVHFSSVELHVAPENTLAMQRAASAASVTMNTLLQGAWALLLGRLSRERDIVFGATRACRRSGIPGASDIIGILINTLPVRTTVDPAAELKDWLGTIRSQSLSTRPHEHTPLAKVQAWSDVERGRPLFESIVVYEHLTLDAQLKALGGEWLNRSFQYIGQTNFPLALIAYGGERLLLRIEYARDRFDDEVAARMLRYLEVLLIDIAERLLGPDRPTLLGDLHILPADERSELLGHDAAALSRSNHTPLHGLFEAQVLSAPDAEAVVAGEERLTYGELNARANRLAHALRQKGVQRNDIVGLAVERNADVAIGILAILKAGAGYLPLDPDYPRDRLAFIVGDAKARLVLASSKVMASLQLEAAECLDIATAGNGQADTNPDVASAPEDLAYVIYTSGSTGKPKGVLVTHANVARLFSATDPWFGFGPHDVWTLFHSYAFDFSVWELWGALLYGGRVVIVPYWISRDPAAFRKLLVDECVTILNQTPSAFRQLVQADLERAPASYALREIIFGGEALELQSLKPWIERYGDARPRLVNMYGITETTVHVTYRPITRADVEAGRGSVIGKPIPDLYIRLLDERGEPVPVGVPGEIWVGGAGVSNGYLNRPELTAQRFVTDPFDPSRAARLYRAGDLARRLPDGDLEFLGRIDAQVKIRGFRIELGEIEAALAACAEVADAAVIAREDIPGDKRLVAYLVGKNASAFNPEDLRTALASTLPGHMVPAHFIALAALPINENGKLDRTALPRPDLAPTSIGHGITSPRSQTEEAIATIWQQVLKSTSVDCREDFFRIGGHSLLATQVASRIRDVFQVELSVALLFEHRTVQSLARHIDTQLRDKSRAAPMPPIEPRASDAPERLSVSQERMWLIHELAPDNKAYNIPVALQLRGQLDIAAMEQAINALLLRHETLRTTYLLEGSHPVQIVQPWVRQPLEIADLSHLDERALEEALVQATAHAEKTFDLGRDTTMRSVLFRLGGEHHLLVMTAHHVAIDDWGFGLLTADLAAAYNNLRAGRPAGLDPLPLTYRDYAAWQRRWLETAGERQLTYWRAQLTGLVPLELPTDKPRPDIFGFQGSYCEQSFSHELQDRLEQLGRREGFTLFMTTLTAYAVLLHRVTGQTDFPIAVPIANRTHTSTEKLVGTFVNTVVIRVDLGGRPSFREALQRVRAIALDAYTHQDAPYETLVEELAQHRDTSRPPLAQVIFNLLNNPAHGMQFDDLNWQIHSLDLQAAQFEIGLTIDTTLSRTLSVEFNSELFERNTITRFIDQYMRILHFMLANLDVCIEDVPLLTVAERDQVLRGWNQTSSSYPSETPFNRLFEDRVEQNPESVAISLGSEALTYAELNARANRMAHVLVRHGAQRGAIVGLCMHRSLDLVVALLAIQKSGAAYLPLDPGFPAERLSYMLTDSGASLLLANLDAADGIEVPPQVKLIELDQLSLDEGPAENIPFAPSPNDPVYVIYTSGSTGRPKGVVVQHGALVNFLHSMQRKPGLSNEDVLAAVTTISFDIAGLELYLPLMVGARLELVARETAADPALLAPLIEASGATVLQATPSTWRMLIEEGWAGSNRLRALCGGEALSSDLAEALLPRVKELWNLYGPTETTIWSSVEKIEAGDRVLTIGRPIANTQLYVVDKAGEPVTVGVPGEIWIGGDGVALGYHRRPELTAERFVPDRFSDRPGGRLYRTGDLGRWLPDGRLQHLGRIDSQVKIRGFRIELGEIEAALNAHPIVRQSAVVTRETRPGDVRIVAYIVVNGGEELTVSEVRRYLRASLPDYMIPSFVMTLQSLPLTANGKLDRGALPDVFRSVGDDIALSEPPAPGMEQRLADIWCETLQIDKVNAGDNFFDLGGHSLLAIRVATALQNRIGWRMDPRNLFFQSLRQIAAQAEAAATRSAAAERIA